MKSLIINTSDLQGGAARAAYRLHQGLQQINVKSRMLVQKKTSSDDSVIGPETNLIGPRSSSWNTMAVARYLFDRLPLAYYDSHHFQQMDWSPQWFPHNIHKKINRIDPDVAHLHWICQGFVPVQEIAKIKQPLVWTLHDMWAFTGGCHYNGTCDGYKYNCGKCPQLSSDKVNDMSNWVWKRKKRYWDDIDFTVVTPSHWLANCARSSSLFEDKRIEVIPNGLDLQRYKPVSKSDARKSLGLPLDKNLILFGALNSTGDERKGFCHLKSAISILPNNLDFEAIVFGNSSDDDQLDIPINYMGRLPENMLNSIYSAADVFVAPSIQDNLPNTVMEALACGTPSVAFDIGGMSDMIKHKKNGYLAKPFDIKDLANGIEWTVEQDQRKRDLQTNSRKIVEDKFELTNIAKRYADLYSKL